MKRKRQIAGLSLVLLAALTLVGVLWPSPNDKAEAAPGLCTPGSLNVVAAPGEKLRTCPLEHTDVEGWIVGDIAHVRVTQRFGNPYDDPIEAVYVFPLPQNSAVNDMLMQIGQRTIRGVIKEREEAKQIYEEAKQAGKTASLLEQERPNIFTQSVANIMPGDAIEITIWYVQDLRYQRGRYEFVFPMVVGPRYIPGGALSRADTGGGWSPDTDQVRSAPVTIYRSLYTSTPGSPHSTRSASRTTSLSTPTAARRWSSPSPPTRWSPTVISPSPGG